jgi:hypothetical protein
VRNLPPLTAANAWAVMYGLILLFVLALLLR